MSGLIEHADQRREVQASGFKEKVLKRNGLKKLVARVYKDRAGTTRLYIEEPTGKRGAVSRAWFSSLEAADRALGTLTRTTKDMGLTRESSWYLGDLRQSKRRLTHDDSNWRLR
jgi:hypothetical protein